MECFTTMALKNITAFLQTGSPEATLRITSRYTSK